MQTSTENQQVWHATVDSSGRVLVPIEIRNELHATKGTSLLWVKTENGLQLKTFEQSIAQIQDYYQSLSPPEDIWSDEIIARRRNEAEHE